MVFVLRLVYEIYSGSFRGKYKGMFNFNATGSVCLPLRQRPTTAQLIICSMR
ncbi:hypothetical protein PISMIDRAFT_670569 [Pisolithus microcarpus 441]|uniref:Uncharacterized protein n=1 Tax=Pisolithus microcarpus 441 TaxID=765257 RepID=A0A0C9ZWY4_9AGAM|nr:hypothetical protein PISMIDRAFT_670569 [Pisolithus microcarpus 441]